MRATICAAFLAGLGAAPALAHPHVWVTAKAELVYEADGRVSAVRHAWTFDPAYSAYVTQGLDKNKDGKLTSEELQELAKINAESLSEFDYFTVVKANGAALPFDGVRDYAMTFDKDQATLTFTLGLKPPARPARTLALEIYDPSYFVAFRLADGDDAVRLAGGPKGCATTITRPKPIDAAQQQRLSEAFFEALTAASNFGANYANRAIVACP
ncbi:MAG TPA: DUF1007 family protein [Beijerinckiaceae bacterium]|nr:DUF1007 family protein [Beijerinckiaceae bacterium]